MSIEVGVVMDPIDTIKPYKDTTFAMLLEAQARGCTIQYMEQRDLYYRDKSASAHMRPIKVFDRDTNWFELGAVQQRPLSALDVILMRKDPPFDMEYIHTTYLLEEAEKAGVLVVNSPRGLRDANEKLATTWFPQCIPETLVTRDSAQIVDFLEQYQDIIVKPLEAMGGHAIFRLSSGDPNISVVNEIMTHYGKRFVMAQRFIPEIRDGDKRILLIDGEPIPYALARIPAPGETRGNLAAGGTGVGRPLTERDHWICQQVHGQLREKGLLFVGLDVIGDYLTEINVTSPTCVRELDNMYALNICSGFFDCIEQRLPH